MNDPTKNAECELENGEKKEKEHQNEVKKSKRKYPGFRKNLLDYVQEFTGNTGVHGFKYMGEQDRTLFEKFCWVILFCVSLYICVDLIIKTYTKWDQSPVLVSFAKSPTPVWQVPFPAVTICSETKTRQTVYNFTDAFDRYRRNESMSDEEMKRFSDSSLICDNHLYNEGEKFTKFNTIEYLMSMAPQFDDVFFTCKWTLLNESCENLFTPILTEEGLCYTFNMLDRTELLRDKVHVPGKYMSHGSLSEGWTLEDGYPKDAKKDTFPRRAMSAGFSAGLFLVLKAQEPDLDYICRGPVQGFRKNKQLDMDSDSDFEFENPPPEIVENTVMVTRKQFNVVTLDLLPNYLLTKILLHHPAEVPRVSMQFFRAPLNQEVVVSVRPDMMTTSEGLREYDPHRRQCYFPTERYLSFYQNYTQQNCQLECLANFTLARCGCVAYHMPHINTTKICGSGSQVCMFEASTDLLEIQVNSGLRTSEEELELSISNCDCLPACTSLTYNAEFSQAKFEWEKVFQAYRANISGEFPGVLMTRLTFFFKEQQFITSERNELYGQTDFLANCGGILGLFTGFSFLSIVEILYFLSLRLMCNVKHYGRHYWSGSPRLVEDDAYVHPKVRK